MSKTTKYVLIGVGVFFFIGILWAALTDNNKPPEIPEQNGAEKVAETNKNEKGGYMMSDIDFSSACEELATSLVSDNISVVSAVNYNHNFLAHYGYDNDNNSIALVTWNGKDKNSGLAVSFGCYGSATNKDNIKILSLTMDNVSLYGSLEF